MRCSAICTLKIQKMKMRGKKIIIYLLLLTCIWALFYQLPTDGLFFFIGNFNAKEHLQKFLQQSPGLSARLLLIDRSILQQFQDNRINIKRSCIFCSVSKRQPITFGLVTPVNRSLEEHILLPIIQAWEGGFWVEQIVYSNYDNFSPIRYNLPLGFILQKGGSMIIEIVLLHQREGDFWWHGALNQDAGISEKLHNVKMTGREKSLALKTQGAFDKIRFESITLDEMDFNVPRNIPHFLDSPNVFMECNYSRADQFHRLYGKDLSPRANMFRHRVRKLLMTAKTILDGLRIPFWISSGTLLGYFRQCDVIPYSQDVDIGVFIQDYNASLISAFVSRGLRLKHKFGRINDGLEISFTSKSVKLDIFFFYVEKSFAWNGGHALVYDKGRLHSGVKYRYKFPKFTLCWTEFLEMKLRIPCETEPYISANYGPDWFRPVAKWHWYKDPFNVEEAGVWTPDEVQEVLQVF